MNNKLMLKLAIAGLLVSVAGTAAADPRGKSGVDHARVVDVTPIVRQVRVETPVRECWQETEYQTIETRSYGPGRSGHASPLPTIAGGIIGGVVGSQFGGGSGKAAMTAVGALVGASMGAQAEERRVYAGGPGRVAYEQRPVTVQHCQTTTSYQLQEHVEGYRVTYVYGGREYQTTMASRPGRTIPVRVTVVPSGRF
ncbi:MAG TPA: glycine zipper 2TM domain-containing protein [Gammaproteobacteria bacterium]|nr:glycine zipper 2TM domain-containing protein [Gammaproteobacteria bacterium]